MILTMGKKRLVIDLNDIDHAKLVEDAKAAGLTVSNYVRKSTGLPQERQGIKRPDPPKEPDARPKRTPKGR